MADYEEYPETLIISDISYEELILSDIVCRVTGFPPRRIFEAMDTVYFSQSTPSATGAVLGDVVGSLTTNGGSAPIVYTFVAGDGDTDNGNFTVDSFGDVAWAITPTSASQNIRVKATDANGTEVEKEIVLNEGNFGWSDPLNKTSLNTTRWTITTSSNYNVAYGASGITVTKTTTAAMDYFLFGQQPDFNDTFTQKCTFSGTYNATTGAEFERLCLMRVIIGGTSYYIGAVKGEGTTLSSGNDVGIIIQDGASTLYSEILAITNGTLEITRNGSDLVEFKVDGVVKHSLTKAGIVSDPYVGVGSSSVPTGSSYTSTLSDYIIESPIGTPYVT